MLGSGTTNKHGFYEISFDDTKFISAEIGLADVIVYAVEESRITGRSSLSRNKDYVNGIELKDWNVLLETSDQRGVAEYTRIMQLISDLLKLSKLDLYQLAASDDQITFLANETEQEPARINLLVQADKLHSEFPNEDLSNELLYGIARQNILLQRICTIRL